MIELTPTAQTRLNDYLNELRHVLSGSSSVDPLDVERDVRDHIDAALVGQTAPVETSALDAVLQKLGSPAHWLQEGESRPRLVSPSQWISALREALLEPFRRLARGPESFRMGYLSFLILAGAWCLTILARSPAPLIMGLPVSFLLSRAALSLFGAERLTTGQKWLLYPGLVVVDLPLAVLIVLAPFLAAFIVVDVHRGVWSKDGLFFSAFSLASLVCFCVGLVWAVFPGALRAFFYPFAVRLSRRIGVRVAVVSLIALVIAGTLLFTVGTGERPTRPASRAGANAVRGSAAAPKSK